MSTAKHLSYADITLPLTPSFIEDKWLKIVHDEYSAKFIDLYNFDQPNDKHLPTPNAPKQPKFSLDTLLWPVGASNPAYFHTIVETARLNEIMTACSPNGDYNRTKPLVMFDGRTGNTITAQMYICGAPRPLNQLGKQFSDLWLLTLTDQRFYWHFARSDFDTPGEAFPTWVDLYAAIGVALDVTIAVETIPAAYKSPGGGTYPGSRWFGPYQTSTAALLDAVATQVGQRIVVGLDGSVKAVNWQTARTAATDYVNATDGRVISGGFISESAIGKYVPESVRTIFTGYESGIPSTTPYVFERFLTSLNITEYGITTGVPNTHMTISSDIVAEIPEFGAEPTNIAEITAYAEQASIDWYGWRLIDTDIVYAGIEPWEPTGWEDEIEWTLKLIEQNPALGKSEGDDPYTKTHVRRGPWTDTRDLPIVSTGPFPTYEDDCLNGYLVQYRKYIVVDPVNRVVQTNREFVQSYGIPCINPGTRNSGTIDQGSGTKQNTINLSFISNVCIDASGGLILQKQNVTVLAVGAVSSSICKVAKGAIDCCPTVTPNPQLVCCPDSITATSIVFALDGPIGINCAADTVANIAEQQFPDSLQYTGNVQGFGFFFAFNLYCNEGVGLRATGSYISLTKPRKEVYYDIELETDPVTGLLFGTIEIPGCGTATLAVTQPCGSGSSGPGSGSGSGAGSGSGGSGGGVLVPTCCGDTSVPSRLYVTFGGACAAIGALIPVDWDAFTNAWKSAPFSACGAIDAEVRVICNAGNFSVTYSTVYNASAVATSCSPLVVETTGISIGICSGTSYATVVS